MTVSTSRRAQQTIPAISVIVPVYNVEDHVIACLESIQRQSWRDFEVLVVNDGSTDSSGDLVAAFCETDLRFRCIHQANRGLSGARNTGMDQAQADVLSFVDSDDRIAPDFLERLYTALQDTGADWVACAVKSCYPDGNHVSHSGIHGAADFVEGFAPHRYRFEDWQQVICHFPSAWNKLYRRSLIDGLHFDEGTWFEDHSFFQRAAARTDHIVHLPRALYWQTRGRDGQITTTDDDRVFEQLQVLRRLRDIMTQGPFQGAHDAYEKLASRLVFERSLSLRDPARRKRFALASAQLLRDDGLTYQTEWDDDIARSWALELRGELPLTVFIHCTDGASSALHTTLDSLSEVIGPGFETILLAEGRASLDSLRAQHPDTQVLDLNQSSQTDLWTLARGRYVTVLRPGVQFKSAALYQQVEQLLRHDAQLALSAYSQTEPNEALPAFCTGFADMRAFRLLPLEKGPVSLDGTAALSLLPEVSARVFERAFVLKERLPYPSTLPAAWALQLIAAVKAPCVVFDPWAGRTVPAPDVLRGAIGETYDAVLAQLPQDVTQTLPQGWQRRLFDRVVQAKRLNGTAKLSVKDIEAMWSAARRGLRGVTPLEAGFDTPLSPHRERVFDPIGGMAAALGRARSRPLSLRQKEFDGRYDVRRDRNETSAYFPFPAAANSACSLLVDVSKSAFVNLDVLAANGLTMPVHFSFRRHENRLVYNRLTNDGWGQEQAWPLALDTPVIRVSMVFTPDEVCLSVNDTVLGTAAFDPALLSPDAQGLVYSGIDVYSGEEVASAVWPLEFVLAPPPPALRLDARLLLQVAHSADTYHIKELTTGTILPTFGVETGSFEGLTAHLPARLWCDLPKTAEATVRLQLETRDGVAIEAPLTLTRADMVAHIKTLLTRRPTFLDSTLALTIVEHVVHAKIAAELNAEELNTVAAIATHFGVEDFLASVETVTLPDDPSTRKAAPDGANKPDPIAEEVDMAIRYLADSLKDNSKIAPLDAVAQLPISTFAQQEVYLAMGAVFARRDQDFAAFFKLAKVAGVAPYTPNGDPWHDSVILPFLALQGDPLPVLKTLRDLARRREGVLATPSLAWLARWAVTSTDLLPRHRDHVVFLLGHLLRRRAPYYWQAVQCRDLTLAAVDLIASRHHLSQRMQRFITQICLQVYGLSRQFWQQLPDDGLPQELTDAKRLFGHVQGYKTDPIKAENALIAFARHKCPDVTRLRRDLFGPAGVPMGTDASPDLVALQRAHAFPAEAALRHAAAPGSSTPDLAMSEVIAARIAGREPSEEPVTDDANNDTAALDDTIVTVFSCKPHLNTRIPVLRDGWLRLLKDLGVPYVVIVGDGDGRQDGDVVHVDAPDSYEGLPQKTLATIDWVLQNTQATHMVKVDDDCFLNAPLFFQSQTYKKFDYYGRKLTRVVGQMDRTWHQSKSTSARGRLELDKSPEPSLYADGGSGYTLSRTAMQAALSAAKTPIGQQLIQTSFMEDKLLGDLLALRGIFVAEEDYVVTVRRRAHKDSIPVPSWQNGFDASRTAPVHLVHMDTTDKQQEAVTRLDIRELMPKKIWPSFQPARLGYQSNALELISPQHKVDAAIEAEVAVVSCMRNEMFMLPHFLAHYRKLGVGAFLIADNSSDDGTLEYLADQPDVAVFSVDTDYRFARYGVAWQQALLAAYRVDKWSLVADADELLAWQAEQLQTLPNLLSEPEFATAKAVRLLMLDMYPKGPLEDATFSESPFGEAAYCDRVPFLTNTPYRGPFSDQPTWTSALRHRLLPGARPDLFVAQKLALLRYQPWMRLAAGLHYIGDAQLAPRDLILAHFKYNAEFRRKAQAEVARGQHFNNAEEYQKYLALLSEGRSVLFDPDLSVRWTETAFAQSIFAKAAN
ncbi:MAG: glycosyltransferase [Shimia sp.]|uniref:glycosyltransferase n=1 Tax=Shimia sp. TaxID=1954381 RepID=UPI0025E480FA|nr:glycosyltransferase [Shimia sp.]MCH2068576.1 glycosyltransferase [Shimia sp.]